MATAEESLAEAPTARKASHHKGGSKQQRIRDGLISYYGFAGVLVSARNPGDGMLIASRAEEFADAHLAVAKVNPSYQRVLELITVAGPYSALLLLHGKLVVDIMANHGRSPLELFARQPKQARPDGQAESASALPYQPVGPQAGETMAPPPPPPYDDSALRVYPDDGLPAEWETALREAARQTKRPYEELRNEALLMIAQDRMAANGHVGTPGALGAPVARE